MVLRVALQACASRPSACCLVRAGNGVRLFAFDLDVRLFLQRACKLGQIRPCDASMPVGALGLVGVLALLVLPRDGGR